MKLETQVKMAVIAIATFGVLSTSRAQQNVAPTSGVLAPPSPVTNVISIDAHNTLLIESQPQNASQKDANKEYSLAVPLHVYSGGIARLFGGTVVPTEVLILPESALRSNFGNVNSGGNNFGANNFGGGFNRSFGQYLPRTR